MLHKVRIVDIDDEAKLPHASSLTEIEEVLDAAIPFNCRAGCCGSCVIEIINGLGNVSEKKNEEMSFLQCLGFEEDNYRLACQCKILGDIEIKKAV